MEQWNRIMMINLTAPFLTTKLAIPGMCVGVCEVCSGCGSNICMHVSRGCVCVCVCVPGMRAQNWGRIVNIASAHGLVGSAHKAP
jgi:NAD(P)-dependent dehydrogenase (short-subunit alcohol dehydrogenase family)